MTRRPPLFCLLSLLVPSSVLPAAEPAAWPQANGPYGNYTPVVSGQPLLDDVSRAKQDWLSETDDLGYAKGSASGYLQNLAKRPGHPGGAAGPIVADGKLFVTTFRPAGEEWAENDPRLGTVLNNAKKPLTDEEQARLKRNLRIRADDLLVAIDQQTGKTVWTAVEAGVGANRYMGKRQGYCVAPAYHDGRVFSLGTLGVLRAYSAKDGRKLWESTVEPARTAALETLERALERRQLTGGMGWDVSLVVAGGVLVVPLFDGNDHSLRGVDVETGKTIWELAKANSRHATPATWRHAGRDFLLAGTVAGEVRLIDPTAGKVLWTLDGLGPHHGSLITTDKHVLVNVGSKFPRKPGDDARYARHAAYRLSTGGADRVWEHPDEPGYLFPTWMDSCARRNFAVRDGRVYYWTTGIEKRTGSRVVILDEATGQVLAETPAPWPAPQFLVAEDKLLMIRDASHSGNEITTYPLDPRRFAPQTEFWSPPHEQTTAYEVYLENPFVDGRLFLRTLDGRVACYDLRKNPAD